MTTRVTASEHLDESACWEAVLAKDSAQDGRFFFGVVTTGVFCRPSCAARRPLRKNVRFYSTPDAAAKDGLRPCRRCRPTESPSAAAIAGMRKICDYVREQSDSGESLTLAALARRAGMSASHFQRTFHAVIGVTPRQFVEACRLDALKRGLRSGSSVTQAIYDAGFGSSSRVYERVDTRLGMTPSDYRAGGAGLEISYAAAATPLGLMMVGATDRGLCFVQFASSEDQLLRELRREYPAAELRLASAASAPQFGAWMDGLRQHLEGKQRRLDLPVAVDGSAFRLEVWRYLQSIPTGEVRSYSEVAAALGRPTAVRAVASACAANRVAIAIPCHRVLRADGELGGYRWGSERKRALLELER